VVRPRA